MASQFNQTLLILGASGDLSARLLLPGLGALLTSWDGESIGLVGSDMKDWDDARWRAQVTESFAAAGASGAKADAIAESTRYVQADVTADGDWKRLLDACDGRVVIYFALPPAITERACQALTAVELPTGTRLVFEKPFGTDAASAEALNRLVAQLVPEEQVHRVDHFLGMSTVLNIAGVRFANRMFEPLFSGDNVESVDIVFDETLGLEGRAGFYDRAGALVDMIQSHLLQVMSLVAMEPPSTIEAVDVRDARAAVLRATRVWNDNPAASSYRARYTEGQVDGRQFPSYADEAGIPADSTTETLAEVVLAIDTWRWAGVPFRLRSGKALSHPRQEVVITFKNPRHIPIGFTGAEQPDRLHIGIALDAGKMSIDLNVNGPGDPKVIDPVTLGTDLGPGKLHEYGEVLKSTFDADPILSVRGDMAVDCWRIIEPVLSAWRNNDVPLQEYPAGSSGPDGWPLPGKAPAPGPGTT
ncbi:glucose-6-phosphate dehydrogenase [Kribbella capetownensis]|uniref:Glucose-6-phosphate dehydrogenase n=1 Tax=Kribbella capetownensis TaxID=1572659 RepID=A0A4R0K321_9ACTN|nr:glucose-6-phosphate dehydrogenase [Kribbella capetownensis]TCC53487.1 glucose-6-phosphate dehydrogenase [Kribbella capetownensis]